MKHRLELMTDGAHQQRAHAILEKIRWRQANIIHRTCALRAARRAADHALKVLLRYQGGWQLELEWLAYFPAPILAAQRSGDLPKEVRRYSVAYAREVLCQDRIRES